MQENEFADIKETMNEFRTVFEPELKRFFDKVINDARKSEDASLGTLEIIKEYTMRGGKRIRPMLLFYSYKCFKSDAKLADILDVCIAMELVQTYLLIHDDVMDDSSTRRGKPTVHKLYGKKYDDVKLGESLAINAGDYTSCLANETIAKSDLDDRTKIEILKIMNRLIAKVTFGQELDLLLNNNVSATEHDILKTHVSKTSTYTFEMPTLIGCALSGADEENKRKFTKYSRYAGLVFQLQDDILGVFGDEKSVGKTIGEDIKEGKMTLLIVKSLENVSDDDNQFIKQTLGKKDLKTEDIERCRSIIKNSGSLDYSKGLIEKYAGLAKESLIDENFDLEGKNFLLEILDYLKDRSY